MVAADQPRAAGRGVSSSQLPGMPLLSTRVCQTELEKTMPSSKAQVPPMT